jgi:hypothetical protein
VLYCTIDEKKKNRSQQIWSNFDSLDTTSSTLKIMTSILKQTHFLMGTICQRLDAIFYVLSHQLFLDWWITWLCWNLKFEKGLPKFSLVLPLISYFCSNLNGSKKWTLNNRLFPNVQTIIVIVGKKWITCNQNYIC